MIARQTQANKLTYWSYRHLVEIRRLLGLRVTSMALLHHFHA